MCTGKGRACFGEGFPASFCELCQFLETSAGYYLKNIGLIYLHLAIMFVRMDTFINILFQITELCRKFCSWAYS